jgi:hypothetical protein
MESNGTEPVNQADASAAPDNDAPAASERKGPLYWLGVNTWKMLTAFFARNKFAMVGIAMMSLAAIFFSRAFWQPYAVVVRRSTGLVVLSIILLLVMYLATRLKNRGLKYTILAGCVLTIAGYAVCINQGYNPYEYLQLWYRFKTLPIEQLEYLPQTDHERIQPQNAIYNLSKTKVADSESLTCPDFVKVKEAYRWTLAIEPKYWQNRLLGDVKEIFNVPATVPSPSFSRENRATVDFDTGEYLFMGRNIIANTIKTFGIIRFFSYSPKDVRYILDGEGNWVQCVSLVHWKGIFFPRPEFGGVHIVDQKTPADNGLGWFKKLLLGKGRWIAPHEIRSHPYLLGQNLLPQAVSRFSAQSFRFKNGFFAPFPGRHRGDIRIPDLQSDANDQPFTTYFKFGEPARDKLYHYFSLEPYHPERHGLNTSLLVPADSLGPCFVYYHADQNQALTGVSAVATKVMDTKKNYGWGNIMPVEYRPWIKEINGKPRFFWLTTVVTKTKPQNKNPTPDEDKKTSSPSDEKNTGEDFITGSVPEIALMEAERDIVIWVDPLKPEQWEDQVNIAFASIWK